MSEKTPIGNIKSEFPILSSLEMLAYKDMQKKFLVIIRRLQCFSRVQRSTHTSTNTRQETIRFFSKFELSEEQTS